MNDKYADSGGGYRIRMGAPLSNEDQGGAHPGGQFDVTRQSAGNGMGVVHAHLATLLARCKTVDEAVGVGVSRELAESHFSTRADVASTLDVDNK